MAISVETREATLVGTKAAILVETRVVILVGTRVVILVVTKEDSSIKEEGSVATRVQVVSQEVIKWVEIISGEVELGSTTIRIRDSGTRATLDLDKWDPEWEEETIASTRVQEVVTSILGTKASAIKGDSHQEGAKVVSGHQEGARGDKVASVVIKEADLGVPTSTTLRTLSAAQTTVKVCKTTK